MIISFLLAIMMMVGLFLLLWAGVGLIQNKRFFSTAPIEVLEVLGDKKERFKGQHVLGYILGVIAILLMLGSIVIGAVNGIRNGFTLNQLFLRFLIIFLLTKAFDIIFFDWILLCNRGFGFFRALLFRIVECAEY
ncbi:MAG: hypothetical protein Q4Q07_10475 [Tissierellia bacterium]|nr:hypothetical protein [Tissierellia bacterium]